MKDTLSKLKKDPVGLLRRSFAKLLVAPIKYRRADGYDAARYWHDRLSKYGRSLQGVGDEGLSEQDNQKMYLKASHDFLNLCSTQGVDFQTARVLEVGCGNGHYAQLLSKHGVKHYSGVDITDTFFPELKREHPTYNFQKTDISAGEISGQYDLILMIDVIEHITEIKKLTAAFDQIKKLLSKNGVLLIAPVTKKGKRSLFYVRFWSMEEVGDHFKDFLIGSPQEFRYSQIVSIRKP